MTESLGSPGPIGFVPEGFISDLVGPRVRIKLSVCVLPHKVPADSKSSFESIANLNHAW